MPDDPFSAKVFLGREVRAFELARAEHARSVSAARLMARNFGHTGSLDLIESGETDLVAIRDCLTEARLDVGTQGIVQGLRRQLAASRFVARLGAHLGRGRPRASLVEIACNRGTATEARDLIDNLFTEPTVENRRRGLWAAPHHFVLEPVGGGVQEIVETFGGAPFPSHFYAHHGDRSGLKLPGSPDYEHELVGTIRLEDGRPIGGVRYQLRNEGNGFRLRVCDEVPRAFPTTMVEVHRMNIASEFVVWFTDWFSHLA